MPVIVRLLAFIFFVFYVIMMYVSKSHKAVVIG